MALALTTDILLRSVGKPVKNIQDKHIGYIVEVTRDRAGNKIEYAILKSDQLLDNEERFFAIPASSLLMKITESGEIILMTTLRELHLANALIPEQCPNPDFRGKPPIFELFEYEAPNELKLK